MNAARKGSSFERHICKRLSEWWTDGERDDVFWRSSQSGGRATVRGRKGKQTAGSYGDITALDPIGAPLLNLFTLELKCGKSHGSPDDLLTCKGKLECHPFIRTLTQASESSKEAGSMHWMIIERRDRREPCMFFPARAIRPEGALFPFRSHLLRLVPIARYRVTGFDFFGVHLDKFLSVVSPEILGKIQL